MRKLSIDDMFMGKQSRYALAIAVAKRARQIIDEINETGERSAEKSTERAVILAIDDFKNHKYDIIEPDEQ